MIQILQGDCRDVLKTLPDESVHCCVTSPPYWSLRDYGVEGQLGLEKTPEEYLAKMVAVFQEVKRILREDGTLFLNLGDSYWGGGNYRGIDSEETLSAKQSSNRGARGVSQELGAAGKTTQLGLKPKDLCGIPWRLAFALQADGWWLRQDIIWHKPNPMPESVTDRCTKAHEYLFLLSKSAKYFFDAEAIKEPAECAGDNSERVNAGRLEQAIDAGHFATRPVGRTCGYPSTRNRRSVWTINSEPYPESHFATFPTALVKPCILAGTSAKGCCPKCGAPWERVVEPSAEYAEKLGRRSPHAGTLNGYGVSNKGSGLKDQNGLCASYTTTGWRPTCECSNSDDDNESQSHTFNGLPNVAVPCTVLDPFGGSGTVGQVALELGRKAILIELNPSYVKLAEKRTNVTPGLQLA